MRVVTHVLCCLSAGEQLYWWGMGLFATGLGHPEVLCGALFNSLCMVEVTRMTEARMTRRPERKGEHMPVCACCVITCDARCRGVRGAQGGMGASKVMC